MVESLQRLIELQRVDDELVDREEENTALPERRVQLADEGAACERRASETRATLAEAEAAQRQAERELQDQEALLKKLEGQQFQVKTNEAYTALLHEMDAARRAISDCETRILEAMDAIETAGASLDRAEREAEETRQRIEAELGALEAREVELAAELEQLRGRREQLCGHIEGDLLARYAKIASRRRPAVVLVSEETCLGCQVDIPPQSYIEILRGEKLISCGNCHRILIHEAKIAAS